MLTQCQYITSGSLFNLEKRVRVCDSAAASAPTMHPQIPWLCFICYLPAVIMFIFGFFNMLSYNVSAIGQVIRVEECSSYGACKLIVEYPARTTMYQTRWKCPYNCTYAISRNVPVCYNFLSPSVVTIHGCEGQRYSTGLILVTFASVMGCVITTCWIVHCCNQCRRRLAEDDFVIEMQETSMLPPVSPLPPPPPHETPLVETDLSSHKPYNYGIGRHETDGHIVIITHP